MSRSARTALAGVLSLLVAAVCAVPAEASQEQSFTQTESASNDPIPVRVRAFEGTITVQRAHDGEAAEALVNLPLDAGDRLRSDARGRAELVLQDGSVIWMGSETTLDIAALPLASGGETLLRLWTGSAIVRRPPQVEARFTLRIDMPHGSGRLLGAGLYRVDFDADRRAWLSVLSGVAELEAGGLSERLNAGERSFAEAGTAPAEPLVFNTTEQDELALWQADRTAALAGAEQQVRSRDYVPRTLVYQAAELEPYGSWVYHDDFSAWAWRPTAGISVGWSPYHHGRWVYGYGGWNWVSASPWGWVTSHYGRWHHLPSAGWVWFPGRVYSSAWVSWYVGGGYVGWCPIGFWGRPFVSINLWFGGHHGYGYGYHGGYNYGYPGRGGYAIPRGKAVAGRGYTQGGASGWNLVRATSLGSGGTRIVGRSAVPRSVVSASSVSLSGPLRARNPTTLVVGAGVRAVGGRRAVATGPRATGTGAATVSPVRPTVSGGGSATVRPRPGTGTRTPKRSGPGVATVRPRPSGGSTTVRPRPSGSSTTIRPRPINATVTVRPRGSTNSAVAGPRPSGSASARPRPSIGSSPGRPRGTYRAPSIRPRGSSCIAQRRSGPVSPPRGSVAPRSTAGPRSGVGRPPTAVRSAPSRPPAVSRSAPRAPSRSRGSSRGTARRRSGD